MSKSLFREYKKSRFFIFVKHFSTRWKKLVCATTGHFYRSERATNKNGEKNSVVPVLLEHGETIRTIILAVRVRKSESCCSPVNILKSVNSGIFWFHLSQFAENGLRVRGTLRLFQKYSTLDGYVPNMIGLSMMNHHQSSRLSIKPFINQAIIPIYSQKTHQRSGKCEIFHSSFSITTDVWYLAASFEWVAL